MPAAADGNPQMSLTVLKMAGEYDAKIKEISDLIKRQNGLAPGLAPSTSREHTQSVLYLRAVQVIEQFLPPRLPPTVYYPRLVYYGDEFAKVKEYRLAARECYSRFMNTDVQRRTGGGLNVDLEEQLALETRSTFGLISCDFFLAMEVDPEMRKPHTVETVVKLLCQTRSAMQVVAAKKELYWLVYNGTVTIFTLCTPLLAFGYPSLVIEFLLFACQSMEAQVPLCQVKYISWRARLYGAVCLAYEDAKMKAEAQSFAERGLKAVKKLQAVESLDPVPPPAAMKRLVAAAELEMLVNVIRYTEGMSGSEAMEKLQELPQIKDQLEKKGVLLTLTRAIIKCIEESQRRAIRHIPAAEHETYKAELLTSLSELIAPKLEILIQYDKPPPPEPDPAADDAEEAEAAEEGEGEPKPPPLTAQDYERVVKELPFRETVELVKFAYNLELHDVFKKLRDSCLLRLKYEDVDEKLKAQVRVLDALYSLENPDEMREDKTVDPKAGEPVVEGEMEHEARVRRKLHSLSRVARELSALTDQNVEWEPDSASGPDLFADAALLVWNHAEPLLDTVDASAPEAPEVPPPLPDPPEAPPKPQPPVEEAPVEEDQPAPGPEGGEEGGGEEQPDAQGEGEEAEEPAAEREGGEGEGAAEAVAKEPSEDKPTKAAWKRPPPTLRQLATLVLQGVHSTFMWVQLDDALLCGTVATRLSFILEKRNRKEDAMLVVEQGIETLNRARSQQILKEISPSDDWQERFALSSVSTNTANINVPRRPNEEVDQALACIQVDLLHAKFRIILQLGVDDARRAAAAIEAKNARQRLQRTKDQTLYGTKSRKMLREECEQADRDQQRPVVPRPALERELIAGCNRNLYEKAIVLIELARLPRKREEREALLAQAVAALEEGERAEKLVEMQVNEPPSTARTSVPSAPRLVMRGATEMIMMADPWLQPKHTAAGAKGTKVPPVPEVAGLALFCKEEGSGVAASLNNVAFRGSGVPRPAGEKILITGLTPNESYVFALAAFDRNGHVIEGIGQTSVPVVAQLPLPLLQIWAHLALSAHVMGCSEIAREASLKLYNTLVVEGAGRRLWEQVPVSRDVLNLAAVARAPPPVLRLFVLVLMQMAEAADVPPPEKDYRGIIVTPSHLSRHKARLRGSKKLVMAVYVAVGIDDEELACKAAIQLYHLLLPLLRMKVWHSSLVQAVTVVRLSIRVLFDAKRQTRQDAPQAPGKGSTMTAQVRRVLSCLSSALLRTVEQLEEPQLLKAMQEKDLDEELYMTTVEGYSPTGEERSLIEKLLCIDNLREKTSAIEENPHIKSEAPVLALLRGSPEEAQGKIDQESARALELTCRVVAEAIAENKVEDAKTWIEQTREAAKAKRAELLTTELPDPAKQPLPSLDMPEEEVEEQRKDEEQAEADIAELKDLEIQFLTPSEEQVEKWENNKVERAERAEARKATAAERLEARREEACNRIAKLLLPKVRRLRERRLQRALVNQQQRWIAALQVSGALVQYDEVLRTNLNDPEKWPEPEPVKEDDPPPPVIPEPQEGEEPPEPPERILPKRAMQSTDPAFVPLPHVPGNLRAPKYAVKAMVRAAVLSCRAREWAAVLNSCLYLSNMVRDLFPSAEESAVVAPYMRAVGDCIVEFLVHQTALVSGAPPPGSLPGEVTDYKPPPNLTTLEYSKGILHRLEQGNRTEHDTVDTNLISSVVLQCLQCLGSAKRWVAMLSLGCKIHAFLDEGCPLEEQLIPHMQQALIALEQADKDKAVATARLAELETELAHHTKETSPGGRLMEGLRARKKERDQVLERMGVLVTEIAKEKNILLKVRFTAMAKLPGSDIEVQEVRTKWQYLEKVYDRDKSRSLLELQRCRAMLATFLKKRDEHNAAAAAAAAEAAKPPEPPAEGDAEPAAEDGAELTEEEKEAKEKERKALEAAEKLAKEREMKEKEAKRHKQARAQAEKIAQEYSKCVMLLREKREKELLPWALHEYGEVLWFLGNVQGAGQAWNDSLDSIFTVMNVGRHWRDQVSTKQILNVPVQRQGPSVLERVGLRSVLAAASIAAKLSKCIYTRDLHLQLEYALFAAHLLAMPFTCGLPHPQRARDFATYVPQELVPDENPFEDAYAVDAAALMDGCEFCGKVLFRNGYGLEMLPMTSLYQWCAKTQVKDSVAYVNASAWKARACAQQGLLSEAVALLFDLHTGCGLPDLLPFERPPQGAQGLPVKETRQFNALEAGDSENNQAILKALVEITLPDGLLAMYSPSLKHLLSMCRIEVLLQVTNVHPTWPHPNEKLQELCGDVENMLQTLRQSLADTATAPVPVPEGEEPPPAPEGDAPTPPPKLNGYTRLALSVVTECDLYSVRLLQKRGQYTEALDKLDQVMNLLYEQDSMDLTAPDALRAFGEKPSDLRHHTDAMLWLECRRFRTELLFLQARWGQLKQETARALQDMAELNEQLLARDVMARDVMQDIHMGKQDLSVSTLQEMIGKAMMLHQEDIRLAAILAMLADLYRAQGALADADGALSQAEAIVEEHLVVRGLPQSDSKFVHAVGTLIRIKVRRADVALQQASSDRALHDCLQLCHEVDLLIPYAPYVGLHTRARFHFFRARARRQLLVLRSPHVAWGGTFVPGKEEDPAAAAEGEDAPPMSQEEQDYAQVVQDLQATLTLTVEAGGYDAQLARCVMLEAACLHGATLVPKQEATHLKRAMHNLKLACEIVAKRRALLQAAVDENTAPVGDLPPFVVAELGEAASERARTGNYGANNDGSGGDEPTAQRGLVSYLLANLREQRLMLFDDDHCIARIGKLQKAMVDGLPAYADACKVSLGPEEVTGSLDPEAGLVMAQWYSPMDVERGNVSGGDYSANLVLVLAPECLADEGGQKAALLCVRVHARSIGEVAREAAAVKMRREESALGAEGKAASSEWSADVFPYLGPLQLQGEAAVAAQEDMLKELAYNANIAAMGLIGVEPPPPEDPAAANVTSASEGEETAAAAEGEDADGDLGAQGEQAPAVPHGPKMLQLENIHLLVDTLSEQGISATEPDLSDVLYSWVKSRTM